MNHTFQSTYYHSPIGFLKIVGTNDYITEISFANEQIDHTEESADNNPILNKCKEELIEFFQGRRKAFTIPVYQKGTEFQQRVWSQLHEIPYGRTNSYLDIAQKLGDPKCVRAAAAANSKNSIVIVIPCHRVIGTDKNLTGYVGGLPKKKWLLQHEFRISNGIQTLF